MSDAAAKQDAERFFVPNNKASSFLILKELFAGIVGFQTESERRRNEIRDKLSNLPNSDEDVVVVANRIIKSYEKTPG